MNRIQIAFDEWVSGRIGDGRDSMFSALSSAQAMNEMFRHSSLFVISAYTGRPNSNSYVSTMDEITRRRSLDGYARIRRSIAENISIVGARTAENRNLCRRDPAGNPFVEADLDGVHLEDWGIAAVLLPGFHGQRIRWPVCGRDPPGLVDFHVLLLFGIERLVHVVGYRCFRRWHPG